MMHEFLCSENPLVPLSIDDMDTASGLKFDMFIEDFSVSIYCIHRICHGGKCFLQCQCAGCEKERRIG